MCVGGRLLRGISQLKAHISDLAHLPKEGGPLKATGNLSPVSGSIINVWIHFAENITLGVYHARFSMTSIRRLYAGGI